MQKEHWIEGVIDACVEIFEMMLPLKLSEKMQERPLPFPMNFAALEYDVIASLGLTGTFSGMISLHLSQELGLKLAGWMMDESYSEFSDEVYESIGEMVNMIAGGLKNRLSSDETEIFDLSLPIVISGRDKRVFLGSGKEYIVVPVDTDQGLFYVTLVLEQKS